MNRAFAGKAKFVQKRNFKVNVHDFSDVLVYLKFLRFFSTFVDSGTNCIPSHLTICSKCSRHLCAARKHITEKHH